MSFVSTRRALVGCQFSPFLFLWLTVSLGLVGPLAAQKPYAKWVVSATEKSAFHVLIEGFSADQLQVLSDAADLNKHCALRLSGKNDVPPVLGRFELEKSRLKFTPRFPLLPGKRYTVQFSFDQKTPIAGLSAIELRVPQEDSAAPKVTAVYPTGDVLPENILKFYLHFSKPMQPGDVYQFIELRDDDGDLVDSPFLEIEQELWSRDGTRLTLLIDPGRIKRGLAPRAQMGPVFEAGTAYRLRIKKAWSAENGISLKQDFVKKFRVVEFDSTQPDPKKWSTQIPQSGTQEPVEIQFEESLDHGLLNHIAVIQKVSDKPLEVAGQVKIGRQEKSWRFVPTQPWQPGKYQFRIDTVLEDLCGNSIGQPFDVDIAEDTGSSKPKQDFVTIDFEILVNK